MFEFPQNEGQNRRSFLSIFPASLLSAISCVELSAAARLRNFGEAAAQERAHAERPLVRYPEKSELLLLTSRPPQLETPMRHLAQAITPNDVFYVRYHLANVPTTIDLGTWRLRVGGHVAKPLDLSMDDLRRRFKQASIVAVNQCSGNSRSYFEPRVFGGQWGDGAVGNAEWSGVRLRDVLAAAGVRSGAVDITFNGLDAPPVPSVPDFVKSLAVEHVTNDPGVLLAYEMNGKPLPVLNGFPLRLVVPGWYATYWVKNLAEITVTNQPFDGFWMKTAYRIPDTPCACVEPGTKPASTVPISKLNVRALIAVPENNVRLKPGQTVTFKGVAFDGGSGIRTVQVAIDNGPWQDSRLGHDLGKYSFREWSFEWKADLAGKHTLRVRATSNAGETQPEQARWNPAGYMRNVIEARELEVTA